RADLLFELTGAARVECQMPRVVRTRGDLVNQQASVPGEEEFDAQHADVFEPLEDCGGDVDRLRGNLRGDAGRRNRYVENVAIVGVLDRHERRDRTVNG